MKNQFSIKNAEATRVTQVDPAKQGPAASAYSAVRLSSKTLTSRRRRFCRRPFLFRPPYPSLRSWLRVQFSAPRPWLHVQFCRRPFPCLSPCPWPRLWCRDLHLLHPYLRHGRHPARTRTMPSTILLQQELLPILISYGLPLV